MQRQGAAQQRTSSLPPVITTLGLIRDDDGSYRLTLVHQIARRRLPQITWSFYLDAEGRIPPDVESDLWREIHRPVARLINYDQGAMF